MKYLIHCIAGGTVIGSRSEDDFGNPLTSQSARKIAEHENKNSQRIAGKGKSRFKFVVTKINQ